MTLFCADGASVNMGVRNGAVTRMKRDNKAILVVHCSLHKLELAISDAFMESKYFKLIDDIMVSLYYFFKHSGKNWRMMMLIAQRMSVNILRYLKAHGTRFQNHKKNALKVFLYNYCVFLFFAENAIHTNQKGLITPAMKTKIEGYFKKMTRYEFVGVISVYRDVLQETSQVSLKMEKESSLISDIIDVLKNCSDNLNEIMEKELELPQTPYFSCSTPESEEADTVIMKVTASNLPSTVTERKRSRLTDKQIQNLSKKIVVTNKQEFKLSSVTQGQATVTSVKSHLVKSIQTCMEQRFSTLVQDDTINSMVIVDHTRWDIGDKDYGMNHIECVSQHFEDVLKLYKYNVREAKFIQLKKLYIQRYPTVKTKVTFWHKIFYFHCETYKNILYLIEICLSIAWAQGMVERGFSTIRRVMTEQRTSLLNENLNNILVLQMNLPQLAEYKPKGEYEKSVVKRSVDKFLKAGKWKWALKVTEDYEQPVAKRSRISGSGEPNASVDLTIDDDSTDELDEVNESSNQDSSDEDDDTMCQ